MAICRIGKYVVYSEATKPAGGDSVQYLFFNNIAEIFYTQRDPKKKQRTFLLLSLKRLNQI